MLLCSFFYNAFSFLMWTGDWLKNATVLLCRLAQDSSNLWTYLYAVSQIHPSENISEFKRVEGLNTI